VTQDTLMRNRHAPHIDFTELMIGKLCPSDIDMVLERKGHFLFGEWKRPGENISEGQRIMLRALHKVPKVTVLIIEGDTDDGMRVSNFWQLADGKLSRMGGSVDELLSYVKDWLAAADSLGEK
jgi:hypothetical protein